MSKLGHTTQQKYCEREIKFWIVKCSNNEDDDNF